MKTKSSTVAITLFRGMAYYPLTPSMVKLLDMDSMKFLHCLLMP